MLPVEKLMTLSRGPEAFSEWKLTSRMNGSRFLVASDDDDEEIDLSQWKIISSSLDDMVIERIDNDIMGSIRSTVVNNDYRLYSIEGETRLVHGILPTEECPYVFVPVFKDMKDPDYQFAIEYIREKWSGDKIVQQTWMQWLISMSGAYRWIT